MYKFAIHDEMAANGSMHFRVLRTLLTATLPKIIPQLRALMQDGFAKELMQECPDHEG